MLYSLSATTKTDTERMSAMLNKDYTTELLDLEEVIVTGVENISEQLHIYIELPRKEHRCPCCGEPTNLVHDYREQIIKDIPLGKKTLLHLKKRRYRCPCGKRFFEKNSFLPRYQRMTGRLIAAVISAFRKLIPASEIGRQFNLSGATTMRYFQYVNHNLSELPEVLSIDEFKGNSGGQKYNTILADPQNKRVLDILPNRFEGDLKRYFAGFASKSNVKYFVCDMNPHFRQVAHTCFPQAAVVADKYHVVRQVFWAMERVRKEEQKSLSDRFRKYFKHSKRLLFKPMEKLTNEEMNRLALMLEISPRLATAYRLKNDFLPILRAPSSAVGR